MPATKLPPALTGTAKKKYASEGRKGKQLIHNVLMLNKLKQKQKKREKNRIEKKRKKEKKKEKKKKK
jgi:hypothetical protein